MVTPEQTALLKANQGKRTSCEVWTRVMGYHRPVSQFNKGKQSEHYERTHFNQKESLCSSYAQ